MNVQIRGVRPEEWERLRELRLRALRDAPMAFGTTFEEDAARPDDAWRERAARSDTRRTFVAEHDGRWLGMATGLLYEDETPAWNLVGMFVEEPERGKGVGAALVSAVCDWARERGAEHVYLWVTESNVSAVALYRRCGFRPTGERQPLPHTPEVSEVRMVRDL